MKAVSKAERLARQRLVRFLFRKLVYTLLICRQWLLEIAQHETTITADAQANITKIIRRQVVKSILSPSEKKALNIASSKRTPQQRRELLELFLSLKCLETFSPVIRALLSTVVQYRCLLPHTVIFQSGHMACGMYILLDGEVALTRDHWVPLKDAWEKFQFHKVVAGNQFGHDAFMNDSVRTHSAQTIKESELLFIYREDFDRILAEDTRFKWDVIRNSLQRYPYFQLWTSEQRTLCCLLSRLVRFKRNQMVYSDMNAEKYSKHEAYFLIDGECEIYQVLHLRNVSRKGCLKRAEIVDDPVENTTSKFVRIGVLYRGAVFNLGEQSIGRFVVARSVVQGLLIPHFWIFQNEQDVGNVWEKKMIDIDTSIPSRRDILVQLQQEQTWNEYKNRLIGKLYATSPLVVMNKHETLPDMLKLDSTLPHQ